MRSPAASRLIRSLFCCAALLSLNPAALRAESAPAPAKKSIIYRIRTGDRLGVRVFEENDLNSSNLRVDHKGTINLPLVQELRVDGMTVNEAERFIEKSYRDGRFLRTPQVTVTIDEYGPREVTITGSVKTPARYPLPLETAMTLLELVSKAGGLTDTARGSAIRVTRVQPDGSLKVLVFDVESILKGKKDARAEDSSLVLEANDLVFVPERII